MDFGELCDEFECISSPLVESTARQLVRDILELREGNRALGTYAVSVKYKVLISVNESLLRVIKIDLRMLKWLQDPVRSFSGRDKYKRQLWATEALQNPTVVRIQTSSRIPNYVRTD